MKRPRAPHRIGWYARRLGRMSAAEITWRVREQAVRRAWARRQVTPAQLAGAASADGGAAGRASDGSRRRFQPAPPR